MRTFIAALALAAVAFGAEVESMAEAEADQYSRNYSNPYYRSRTSTTTNYRKPSTSYNSSNRNSSSSGNRSSFPSYGNFGRVSTPNLGQYGYNSFFDQPWYQCKHDIDDLEHQIMNLQNTERHQDVSITNLNSQITTIQNWIDPLDQQIEDNTGAISTNTQTNTSQAGLIGGLRTQVNGLRSLTNTMNMMLISLNAKVDLWPTAADLNAQIAALTDAQTTLSARISSTTDDNDCTDQVNTLRDTTLPGLATDDQTLQNSINAYDGDDGDVDQLVSDVSAAAVSIGLLQTLDEFFEQELTKANEEIASIEGVLNSAMPNIDSAQALSLLIVDDATFQADDTASTLSGLSTSLGTLLNTLSIQQTSLDNIGTVVGQIQAQQAEQGVIRHYFNGENAAVEVTGSDFSTDDGRFTKTLDSVCAEDGEVAEIWVVLNEYGTVNDGATDNYNPRIDRVSILEDGFQVATQF